MISSIYMIISILLTTHICGSQPTKRCDYDLGILWTQEISHSPFAAAPLITDINADGKLDVVAAPFTEEITVLDGETGVPLLHSKWPYHMIDNSVHASPLQYDIDGDGIMEVFIITSNGEFMFFKDDGTRLTDKVYKLPGLVVARDWHQRELTVGQGTIHDFILDTPPSEDQNVTNYVTVDPHVLATPVIADLNRDNVLEELAIPVSYYFDSEYYRNPDHVNELQQMTFDDLKNYLCGGIVLFNLTSFKVIRTLHLELTKVTAEYPGYILSSPTIVDVDSNGSELEIVQSTSAGTIHVVNSHGKNRPGFPVNTDALHGQVTAADLNGDGKLELIVVDVSSHVLCYNMESNPVWETSISGTSAAGTRVADVDQDGKLDVIIAANDGQIWALRGDNGKVLPGWPFKVGYQIHGNPLITRLLRNKPLDIVVIADDGHIHTVSGDSKCRQAINIGETSLVQVLSHDLVSQSQGLELLVATQDGTLVCLGHRWNKTDGSVIQGNRTNSVLNSWPAEARAGNTFMYTDSKQGLVLEAHTVATEDVTGKWFSVSFTIIDELVDTIKRTAPYEISIYFGSQLMATHQYRTPGTYDMWVQSPGQPTKGQLYVVLTNRHGQVYTDSMAVRFNLNFLSELQWLLLTPTVAMGIILLILHGFPAADLLPLTQPLKGQ